MSTIKEQPNLSNLNLQQAQAQKKTQLSESQAKLDDIANLRRKNSEHKTEEKIENKKTTQKANDIKDGFSSQQTNIYHVTKSDLEPQTKARFEKEFGKDLVLLIETELKCKIDEKKALKLKDEVTQTTEFKTLLTSIQESINEQKADLSQNTVKHSEIRSNLEQPTKDTFKSKHQTINEQKAELNKKDIQDKKETPAQSEQNGDIHDQQAQKTAKEEDANHDYQTEIEMVDPYVALLEDDAVYVNGHDLESIYASAQDTQETLSKKQEIAAFQAKAYMQNVNTNDLPEYSLILLSQCMMMQNDELRDLQKQLKASHEVSKATRQYLMSLHQTAQQLDQRIIQSKNKYERVAIERKRYELAYDDQNKPYVKEIPEPIYVEANANNEGNSATHTTAIQNLEEKIGPKGVDELKRENKWPPRQTGPDTSMAYSHWANCNKEMLKNEVAVVKSRGQELQQRSKEVSTKMQASIQRKKNMLEQWNKMASKMYETMAQIQAQMGR